LFERFSHANQKTVGENSFQVLNTLIFNDILINFVSWDIFERRMMATNWTTADRFLEEAESFLFATTSRLALELILPGSSRPGRGAGHVPQSTDEVKNVWSFTSAPLYMPS
jgi:hypothetical protein